MNSRRSRLWPGIVAAAALAAPGVLRADSTVVFNELMYHPLEREPELEWVELHNQLAVAVDISGWSLADGVRFTFPAGTVIRGGGFVVVAASPDALEEVSGFGDALGPLEGRLDNAGESVELRNNSSRRMDRVDYDVSGDWPVAPDGSGVSLAKVRPQAASARAANWAASDRAGGTPGRANYPAGGPARRSLAFSEVFVGEAGASWVEVSNASGAPVDLAGLVLATHGASRGETVLASLEIPAGGSAVLRDDVLGQPLVAGDRLFLLGPERDVVIDALRLREGLRGRLAGGDGRWLTPSAPTPGGENRFDLEDDVVINEIMYHAMDTVARPATFDFRVLLPLASAWRYDATGRGQSGPAWRQRGFDDGGWQRGEALFFNESAELPGEKRTELPLGIATYYFRGEFVLAEEPDADVDLVVRPVVDDGAVVYLNGVEIFRMNMPDGEPDADTLASRSVGNAVSTGPFVVPRDSLVVGRNVVAVEVHQSRLASNDVVFGLEVSLRAVRHPAEEYSESPEAWVELFNRGNGPVDLGGWRFSRGIRFEFPAGVELGPGEHVVVASDRELVSGMYPGITVLGDFDGRLSHRGELLRLEDAIGNPADEVRYFDDGRWPELADGGGSSLERRDPHADARAGESWAASDETAKMGWESFSYRAVTEPDFGPTQYREFVIGLLDAGELLIDDIRVVESPGGAGRELLKNGDFESGAIHWRILGNHERSRVVPDPDDPSNRVLHVIATGPTEHMHNHLETTLVDGVRVVTQREYEVRFRARWLGGSNQLHTRLYFNRVPRTTVLPTPARAGTPGARNSTFEENTGPTFRDVSHSPMAPRSGQEVTIRARADDPDGVELCRLDWSVDDGPWRTRLMERVTGGFWEATVPGQATGRVVQFLVSGRDTRGATSTFPAGGRDSRALFRVDTGDVVPPGSRLFRLLMTPADAARLHEITNVMSNQRMGCTVIDDDGEVFYDVGVRLKGSERGRQADIRVGFNVRFHREQLFRGVHRSIHIDRSIAPRFGRMIALDEILIKHMVNHAGGIPGMYDDLVRFIAPRDVNTGPAALFMARYTDVFLESSFENGGDGTVHEFELIYYPLTTTGGPEGLKLPVPDRVIGVDFEDLGDDRETYRWNWIIKNNRSRDDYDGVIRAAKALDLTGESLDQAAGAALDVDEWARAYALLTLSGVRDVYGLGLNHNIFIYTRPADGRVIVMPWDMDIGFAREESAQLLPDQNLGRLIRRPHALRAFYFHLGDILDSTFNEEYMAPWIEHYGELAGQDYDVILNYIRRRGSFARARLPEPVDFAVTTNRGEDFSVPQPEVIIEGDAGIDVRAIALADREEAPPVSFPQLTRWRMRVLLEPGENPLLFLAFGGGGELLATASITITAPERATPDLSRGDCNDDGEVSLSDAICILDWLFRGAPEPGCVAAADLNADGSTDISDPTALLGHLFLGAAEPPPPFATCGPGTETDAELGCVRRPLACR